MSYWLIYRDRRIPLGPGGTILGRSATCHVVLQGDHISRQHARVLVSGRGVFIEDLSSSNGVFLNGERISARRAVSLGDRIVVPGHTLELGGGDEVERQSAETAEFPSPTLEAAESAPVPSLDDAELDDDEADPASTRRLDAFGLLASVADRMFAEGQIGGVENMLSTHLQNLLTDASTSAGANAESCEIAATYALRLCEATGKAEWIDYCLRLYTQIREPFGDPLLDSIEKMMLKVRRIDVVTLRRYLSVLDSASARFDAAARFRVQRIRALEHRAR